MKVLTKGVRLSLRIARTPPLSNELELKMDKEDTESFYYPGHMDPDKVSPPLPPPIQSEVLFLTRY